MRRATRLWQAWVAHTSAPLDTRVLAMLRIGVALCLVSDLLRVAQLGLVRDLFLPYSLGGLSKVQDPMYLLPPDAGPALFWGTLGLMALVGLGVGGPTVIVAAVLADAQLGHLYPPGDRAIDRVLRTTLLVLAFTVSHRRWALGPWLRRRPPVLRAPGWPLPVLRTFLLVVYLSAAAGKLMQQPHWLAWTGTAVLYRVFTDPMAAHVDPVAAEPLMPLWRVLGWGTIALEGSAFLIFTRLRPWWGLLAAGMHVGIAATMELGMFSWGMLALYPVVLTDWIVPWLLRRDARNAAKVEPNRGVGT